MTAADVVIGSLFSGIGGLDLGLERGIRAAGLEARVAWQVEADPFRRAVLATHWPSARRLEDVRAAAEDELERVDLICGGFPCQDVSVAGRGAGVDDGARSGLWGEFARLVRGLRPLFVVVENSPALRSRGLGRVLGDLASCGYDATWDCLPASAFGAAHDRDRIFVVAWDASHPYQVSLRVEPERDQWEGWRAREAVGRDDGPVDGWDARPGLARVDDGIPRTMDGARNAALGDAVVPPVGVAIGRAIADALQAPGANAFCGWCGDQGEALSAACEQCGGDPMGGVLSPDRGGRRGA